MRYSGEPVRPFDVIIAAHGPLATGMASAASVIAGDLPGVTAVTLEPTETPESFRERLDRAIAPGRPTLVLADLAGGTPHNVASALQASNSLVRCVAGVNLGLVLEAVTARDSLGDALIATLVDAARGGIVAAGARAPGPV